MSKIKDFLQKYLGYAIGAILLYFSVKNKGKAEQIQKQKDKELKDLKTAADTSNKTIKENLKNAQEVELDIRKSSNDDVFERLSKYNRD